MGGAASLMLSSSGAYKLALPLTHRREHRFVVRTVDGVILTETPVPIGSGSVRAQLTSRVSRSATFTTSAEWFPVNPADTMSPYHAIAEIYSGIGYPTGESEVFPVFTGRIYNARMATDGGVTFRADDLAAEVLAADFEQPLNSRPGGSVIAEMERIILQAFPWATFGTHDVTDAVVPRLTWDNDPGKALDDLAAVVGGRWFTLGNGDFVIRRYAYTDLTPVTTLTDGPTGLLSACTLDVTADDSYNAVVVTAERVDGGDPIRVMDRDDNYLSPTFYGGLFGKRLRQVRAQSAATIADAQRLAAAQLAASTALSRQATLVAVPDMTIEPGDIAAIQWRGISDVHAVDSLVYPLDPTTGMSLATRSAVTAVVSI